MGNTAHPTQEAYASCGSWGKHPGNIDRDARRWLKRTRKELGFDIEGYHFGLTCKKMRGLGTERIKHTVILPHEVLYQLHKQGGTVWKKAMYGPGRGPDEFAQFWRQERELHPEDPIFRIPVPKQEQQFKLHAPTGIHGDDVRDTRDDKVCVISWNCIMSLAASWDSRWLFSCLSYRRLSGRATLWEIIRVLKWSLYWARKGVFPDVDHEDNPWPAGSWRAAMAGSPLAGPTAEESVKLAFAQMRGDNDFYAFLMGWNSYRHNDLCNRCRASKVDTDRIWTDFSDNAGYLATLLTTAEFLALQAENSPVTEIEGWTLDRTANDPMHGLNLGTDQHVCGNVLYDEARESGRPKKDWDLILEERWHAFQRFCRRHGYQASLPQFTLRNIGMDKSSGHPLMNAKAAKVRVLLRHLAHVTYHWSLDDESRYSKTRSLCLWAINTFHHCMESSGRVFSDDMARQAVCAGRTFLVTYSSLSRMSVDAGRRQWHLVPKHHYFVHTLLDIELTKRNPKFGACWGDEDFVGRIARGTAQLHRSTMPERQADRYLDMLRIRWDEEEED